MATIRITGFTQTNGAISDIQGLVVAVSLWNQPGGTFGNGTPGCMVSYRNLKAAYELVHESAASSKIPLLLEGSDNQLLFLQQGYYELVDGDAPAGCM